MREGLGFVRILYFFKHGHVDGDLIICQVFEGKLPQVNNNGPPLHKTCSDASNLSRQFAVRMRGVYDLQLAEVAVSKGLEKQACLITSMKWTLHYRYPGSLFVVFGMIGYQSP